MSFANGKPTPNGGTHTGGLRSGAARGVHDFINSSVPRCGEMIPEDLCSGLTAVVSVWLTEPQFVGALRPHLGNPEVEDVVSRAMRSGVRAFFEANAEAAKRVVDAVILARDVRVAATAIRKKMRQPKGGE
jgi:DNA gyrase/topoisomerase IV subunit B